MLTITSETSSLPAEMSLGSTFSSDQQPKLIARWQVDQNGQLFCKWIAA
jgi:hypothetical protein